jgi:hypothetical protein
MTLKEAAIGMNFFAENTVELPWQNLHQKVSANFPPIPRKP